MLPHLIQINHTLKRLLTLVKNPIYAHTTMAQKISSSLYPKFTYTFHTDYQIHPAIALKVFDLQSMDGHVAG